MIPSMSDPAPPPPRRPAISGGTTVDETGESTGAAAPASPSSAGGAALAAGGQMPAIGEQVDHFRIVRPVGHGGMGQVYLARDVRLGRKVALKMVHARKLGSQQAIDRFLFEARTTARFNHPHIVAIHAVGEHQGRPYVALEYLEGENLRERLGRERPSTRGVARLGLAIAEALAEAHGHGVLHRDLKPENVLLPRDGRLRVVDFGLAKLAGSGDGPDPERDTGDPDDPLVREFQTADRRLCGTPAYMSPEQWEGADVTAAADLWALGLMLYEAIAGERPYAASEGEQPSLAVRVCGPEPVPMASSLGEIPGDLADLVFHCLEKEPERRPTAAEVVEVLRSFLAPSRERFSEEEGPFRGLEAFTERHAGYFHGRDGEIGAFLERLRVEPVLPVVGPSGAGKSSFVQAGVVPRLREQGTWTVLTLRPGGDPFHTLATRLLAGESTQRARSSRRASSSEQPTETVGLSRQQTAPDLSIPPPRASGEPRSAPTPGDDRPEGLAASLRDAPRRLNLELQRLADASGGRVLLFVDQLEEIHTLVPDEAQRRAFLQAVCTAADDPEAPVRVLFTLRDDFLGRLAVGPEVREALGRVTVLRSPAPAALEEILVRPLEAVGYRYDDDALVGEMVAEVRGEPACLPLLQFTARLLWDHRDRDRRLLRRAAYRAAGGVAGALADHAQSVLAGLTPAQTGDARDLLLRLVTPERTRRRIPRSLALDGLGPGADEVLGRLIHARLVTVYKGRSDADAEVELVHESLIRRWRQLRHWFDESRDELAFLEEVGQAADLWERRGRRPDEVWSGDALRDARRTLQRLPGRVPARIRTFLEASRAQEQRVARRRQALAGLGVAALAAIALVAVIAALALADRSREAQRQRRAAELGQAEARLEGARAALMRGDRLEARAQLRGALETEITPVGRALWGELAADPRGWSHTLGAVVNDVAFTPDGGTLAVACGDRSIYLFDTVTREVRVLRGHTDQVYTVEVSSDGHWLASGSWSGELRLWQLETGETRELAGHDAGINFVAFSPDGTLLASGSDDHTVRLWSLTDGGEPRVLAGHTHRVYGVAFSPDGRTLASAGRDHVVRLWDVSTGAQIDQLPPRPTSLTNLAFSPDGARLALAGPSTQVSVWTLEGREEVQFSGHAGKVWDVAFTPDGQRLVSVSRDGTIRIWDADSGRSLTTLHGPGDALYCVGVSRDGQRFATGGGDKTVQLWELPGPASVAPDRGHTGTVFAAAFAPDGRTVASVGADGATRLWDTESGAERHALAVDSESVTSLAFSPDGERVWTGGRDGKLRVWLTDSPGRRRTLEGNPGGITDLAMAADGAFAVTAGGSARPYVWDPKTRASRRPYAGHTDVATTVAISPDGGQVATAGYGRAVHVWDPDDGRRIALLEGHGSPIRDVAYAPDGALLASVGDDGTVRLWPPRGGDGRILARFDARAYGVAFAPGGDQLGVALSDGTARLVDTASGQVRTLRGHRSEVNGLAFSPDGTLLVTVSDDATVRLWETSAGQPRWRAPLLAGPPVALATHTGWRPLDGGEGEPTRTGWRRAVADRGLDAALSDDGSTLCLLTPEGVEAWDTARDERLFTDPLTGGRDLLARPDGCVSLTQADGGGGRVRLHARSGERTDLAGGALAIARDGSRLLVAGRDDLRLLDASGAELHAYETGAGVTAALGGESQLVAGFADGSLEIFPLDGSEARPAFSFEGVPSSPVVRLEEGPLDTLIAGFASGQVGIWYRDNGQRLAHARLHGPVLHTMLDGASLHVATELGDHATLDLSAYYLDECALLRAVWDRVPVVWEAGLPVRREAPASHRCASP